MIFVRSLVVWLAFIFAESLNGILRNLWLVPALGDHLAHLISFGLGAMLILTIATLSIRWIQARHSQLIGIGLFWLLLTLGFELSLGRFLGYSWEKIAADYNLAQGGLMLIGLLLVAGSPILASKLQKKITNLMSLGCAAENSGIPL